MTPIERLIAKDEIRDLSYRYMRGIDRRDGTLQHTVFWPDATTDYGIFKGAGPAFVDWCQDLLKGHKTNLHLTGQILIDFESDTVAFGEVYYFAYHRLETDDGPQDLIIAGRYIDRYEARAGVWKFAHRSELIDWVRSDPAAEHFLTLIPDALIGAHGAADLSSQRDRLRTA